MKKEKINGIKVKTDLPCNEINAKTSASSCWMMGIFFLGLKRKAHHPREATLVYKNKFYIEKTQNKLQTHVGAGPVSAQEKQNALHTNKSNNNENVGGACYATQGHHGITLIALVITIIVLLILAGVTISLILGDEGIFKIAETSVEKQKMAEYEEKIELSKSKALGKNNGIITIDDLINQIYEDKIVTAGNINKMDEEKAKLTTKEGYEFIITTTKTEYVSNIDEPTTVKITKEIKGIEEGYINILITIEDEEHGIKEIVKPDGLVITSDNKTKIAIDYKVEEGKDYIFKITNGEGKVKNGVIKINSNEKLLVAEDITVQAPSGWDVTRRYVENLQLSEYNKIQITFSFSAGYDWSIAVMTDDNYSLSLDGSYVYGHSSVPTTTKIYDLPKDKIYTKLRLASSSLNAVLRIDKIYLIK